MQSTKLCLHILLPPPTYARYSCHPPRLWSDCAVVRGSRIASGINSATCTHIIIIIIVTNLPLPVLVSTPPEINSCQPSTPSIFSFFFCNGRPNATTSCRWLRSVTFFFGLNPTNCLIDREFSTQQYYQYWTDPVLVHKLLVSLFSPPLTTTPRWHKPQPSAGEAGKPELLLLA
ncbi:unnamed protein product [Macrosiphum euphorbiae]|uniref:Uncharacterized protein n=1 Tax=Macrosiphum euphorbiae TaxID=13131 RepID=A0AAV0VSX8_9HEMI|nr:unnamed protein product [Macrosiphum euphorbiae]CAI6346714.1 unnamed protein product [Macrosiphum euphorbiae]CAI6358763.1 unnamed protein product [Macrosiphum euphorbiae]